MRVKYLCFRYKVERDSVLCASQFTNTENAIVSAKVLVQVVTSRPFTVPLSRSLLCILVLRFSI